MNLEIHVISGEEIIQFFHTLMVEKVSNSVLLMNPPPPGDQEIPVALSIDTYVSYMFMIAILLGFFYFKKLNIKNK